MPENNKHYTIIIKVVEVTPESRVRSSRQHEPDQVTPKQSDEIVSLTVRADTLDKAIKKTVGHLHNELQGMDPSLADRIEGSF